MVRLTHNEYNKQCSMYGFQLQVEHTYTHTCTFDVTVQYGVRVQVVHSLQDLLEIVEALVNWQWSVATLFILQHAV